jgi:hypothetical protein
MGVLNVLRKDEDSHSLFEMFHVDVCIVDQDV